ncbi:MAG: GTPase HflX [Chloroflexota bacterium]|nr:GTPase HflX [Chloroflexota bacterium]
MIELHQTRANEPERALLVGVSVRGNHPILDTDDSLNELAQLADTAGMNVIGHTKQNLVSIDPATFVGSGKVDEIRETLLAMGTKTVIFDDELSPRHQRELEKRLGEDVKVLDRSALILDIFAQHARTREGALQVELAQYEYRLPRLTRQWTHLSRQGSGGSGGVGLRGPGETQLEVDRRDIRHRISHLKSELQNVREHRSRYRATREKAGIPLIALVGYTNAGKSTLLHALSGADIYIADQLFATLDPTTRRVALPSGRQVLMTDTVGFIQKLPTSLIASFRATLEEIHDADLLLEVVDASHPNVLQHIETVEDTLAEIEVPPVPRLLVWNKIDLVEDGVPLPSLADSKHIIGEVSVSAARGLNMDKLSAALESALSSLLYKVTLLLPYQRGDLASLLHESASVEHQEHTEDGILLTVSLPTSLYNRYKEYRVQE